MMKPMLISYFLIMLITHPACRTEKMEGVMNNQLSTRLAHGEEIGIKSTKDEIPGADSPNFNVMEVFRRTY